MRREILSLGFGNFLKRRLVNSLNSGQGASLWLRKVRRSEVLKFDDLVIEEKRTELRQLSDPRNLSELVTMFKSGELQLPYLIRVGAS